MDYDDNDCEGHNLHLAGEESSKTTSVLRPFALPKFDFDDNLHGQLRFDSLVENEVFLGIPSQEDNQWIEDFSRGSGGIEFSSSAAESCALPRRNNVWSEATSSESVEMLLKAVGQEEMVPGENMNEESDPGDQLGSSAKQMETHLRQNDKMDGVDNGNPSNLSAEVQGNFSRLNQCAGVEGVLSENSLQVQVTKHPSFGLFDDGQKRSLTATSESLHIDVKSTSDNQGETCGLVNESLSEQVQENLPVPGIEIDSRGSSSQKASVSVMDSGDQDKASDISFAISSCIGKGIFKGVEKQQEECDAKDERFGGSAAETVNLEMHYSLEILPKTKSTEEHAVEICSTNFAEDSSQPPKGESLSTVDRCNEFAFVIEPASGSECGTVVFSSETESKRPAEGCLCEKSSFSLLGEGNIEGLGIKGGDSVAPSNSVKQVPVTQPSNQLESSFGSEDIYTVTNEASPDDTESSMLADVLRNPSSSMLADVLRNPSEHDSKSYSRDFSVAGECCGEKSLIEELSDTREADAIDKRKLEYGDHVTPPLLAENPQTCEEYTLSTQADVQKHDLDVSACEEGKKLPLDSSSMVCDDNEKGLGSTFSALNTDIEDTRLRSTCVRGDELADSNEWNRDQRKETEFECSKEKSTSISKESLEMADELVPAIDNEKGMLLDSAASGRTEAVDQSVSLVNTFGAAMHGEASQQLNEKMEDAASDLIVQDDGAEAAASEKPMEAEVERSSGTNSSIVSVTSCATETGESNQLSASSISSTEQLQSEINKQDSLTRNDVHNVGQVPSTSMNSGVNALSKEDGTFTFDIRPLGGQSTGDSGKGLQSFSNIQTCKLSLTSGGSPSTSGSGQIMRVKEISHGSSFLLDGGPPPEGPKGPFDRKTRCGSSKSGKQSAKKENQVKETTPLMHIEREDKSCVSLSPLGPGQLMTLDSVAKRKGAVSIPTSNLPDLNTSAPSSAFFQQPFTDLQQVQLRSQIFVYGSLIQGVVPDEAYMVSAFDGRRSSWEPSWRACVERVHGQKSQGNNTETPLESRSGSKAPDQASRQGFPQSEVLSSPAGRASNKAIHSPVLNPMIPLSSPLWNISTPSCEALPSSSMARSVFDYQAVSPLNPYHTPPIRNFLAHTTSWPSQAPFPVPWLATSQSSPFDISANYSAFPLTEPVKITPAKESSAPTSSGKKPVIPTPETHTGSATIYAGTSSLVDMKKVTVSTSQTSADTKTRKRRKRPRAEDVVQTSVTPVDTVSAPVVDTPFWKKAPAAEDLNQMSLLARNQAGSMSTPVVSSHYSTSVAVAPPSSFVPKGASNQFFSAASPSILSDHLKRGDLTVDKRAIDLEGFSKVKEAKLQAEDAATHATAAVSHCQGVWSQLNQQKNSGLMSDAEAKLASAAVAIAAAASVAKAAAAAAKIASTAAVQAKQMAHEAVTNCVTVNISAYDSVYSKNNLANATPLSILKGGDKNNTSSLAISAAREAARKRVEAASAATRHAENLDAIVKAAELAAEAVSHAGKIVSVGDPFPLSELVEAGPDGCWKVSQVASVPCSKPNDMEKNISNCSNFGEVLNVFTNQHAGPDKDMHVASHVVLPIQRELSRNAVDDHVTVEESFRASIKHGEKNSKNQKDKYASNSAKHVGIVSEMDIESSSKSLMPCRYESSGSIKEGSLVEVLKDRGDLKKAWFSGNILGLKDGEALVCYTDLQSDEGLDQLQEWVSLEAEDGSAPIVRIPHPMTAVQLEGTRKRRRAAVKDYAWSVGDKVDAWLQDCWREGIISEKNKNDPSTLSVHFPAQGETLIVKVWHLRPTVIWRDGQWIEWCRPGQDGTFQGDTPVQKRPKLGSTGIGTKGKGKMTENMNFVEIGRNEAPRLPLSAKDSVFSIGSTRDENNPNMVRTGRSGLQKEGSRVVFGVPRPGKKKKFMEVSKHYVSDGSTKTNVPQGSGSRGWKNNSKIEMKEKQAAESIPKALRSGKPPSIPSRNLARKDNSTFSRPNASDAISLDHLAKGSVSNNENESGEQNLTDFGSFSNVEESSGGTMVSQALPPENRKKSSARNTKSERLNKGKLAPANGKSIKSESNKMISEAEPRRSIRRIQPTSRLLEGLQSSLIISKIPSTSHDKSHRSHGRGASTGDK